MIGIVVSEPDEASVAIGEQLQQLGEWSPTDDRAGYRRGNVALRTFDDIHLSLESVANAFADPSLIVFVSRHAGETGPLLTTHFPGNIGSADYGGEPHTVPQAAPAALDVVYRRLVDETPEGFDVGIECTHHGPSHVGAPCLFVEVGSGPDEWRDERAAQAVARAVSALADVSLESSEHTIVGLGGDHYAPRFERILAETDWQVGHIAADWAIDELPDAETTRAVVTSLFEASGTTIAVGDGIDDDLSALVESLGYRVVSETWVRETDRVPLDLVEVIENALGSIDDGTRIGHRLDVDPSIVSRVTFPDELIDELQAADRPETIETWRAATTAYRTIENGNRLTGEVLLPETIDPSTIVDASIPILDRRYDEVTWDDRHIEILDRAFDPAKAIERGVPEGPAFGRLADGESITIDGTVIEPEQVSSTEHRLIKALPH